MGLSATAATPATAGQGGSALASRPTPPWRLPHDFRIGVAGVAAVADPTERLIPARRPPNGPHDRQHQMKHKCCCCHQAAPE